MSLRNRRSSLWRWLRQDWAMTKPPATSEASNRLVHAVPHVVVGHPGPRRGQHRQARGRAVQGLDLRLLVHGQDQGVLGRAHVEADNVADLADELRVRLTASMSRPGGASARTPARSATPTTATAPSRLPSTSLTSVCPGQGPFPASDSGDRHLDLLVGDLPRRPGPRRVRQVLSARPRRTAPATCGPISRETRARGSDRSSAVPSRISSEQASTIRARNASACDAVRLRNQGL